MILNKFTAKQLAQLVVVLCLAASLLACVSLITPKVQTEVAQLKSGNFTLDKQHTALLFKIQHLGLSSYVGRFNQVSASLTFNPNNLQQTVLDAVVEINSLDINDENLKHRLMGVQWFHQAKYPTARFTSHSIQPLGNNEFEFIGDLNFRGQSKPLSVTLTFHGGANNILTGKYTIGFSATASLLRSDFGMDAFIPLVGDQVNLEAYAEFQRQKATQTKGENF